MGDQLDARLISILSPPLFLQDMEKDPNVVTELEVLRQRKSELESRLMELQVGHFDKLFD